MSDVSLEVGSSSICINGWEIAEFLVGSHVCEAGFLVFAQLVSSKPVQRLMSLESPLQFVLAHIWLYVCACKI